MQDTLGCSFHTFPGISPPPPKLSTAAHPQGWLPAEEPKESQIQCSPPQTEQLMQHLEVQISSVNSFTFLNQPGGCAAAPCPAPTPPGLSHTGLLIN